MTPHHIPQDTGTVTFRILTGRISGKSVACQSKPLRFFNVFTQTKRGKPDGPGRWFHKKSRNHIDFITEVHQRLERKINHSSRISFILQEFIKESAGSDYRVLVLDEKIIGAIQRTAQDDDFKANIYRGGKAEKIKIPPEMEKMTKKFLFILAIIF